jgi:hypothetical protein
MHRRICVMCPNFTIHRIWHITEKSALIILYFCNSFTVTNYLFVLKATKDPCNTTTLHAVSYLQRSTNAWFHSSPLPLIYGTSINILKLVLMVYSSKLWHLTSGTPIIQCDAQHAKRSCIDNSHLMTFLMLQLSFKFWSPIHHTGHLILVPKS